jgi:hypothetical protein
MSSQLSRLVLGSFVLFFAFGCSAPADEDAPRGELGQAEQALTLDTSTRSHRGESAEFSASATNAGAFDAVFTQQTSVERHKCEGNYCDCTGDPECNDMFSGTDCATGPKSAICQIRGEVPKCRCTRAAKAE